MFLLKNLIRLIPLVCWIASCGQVSNKQEEGTSSPHDSVATVANVANPALLFKKPVEEFIDSAFGGGHFNGCILVAKDGQVISEHYYGYTNPRQRTDTIKANTAFHLASVSKTLTATAILRLWQDGKLNVHDTVSKYLPGFPYAGVTIKSLLNHRSGLPNYVHYMEKLGWNKKQFITNQDVLNFLISHKAQIRVAPPDRHFSYSNTNYALLALIIEKVSGMPYREYLQQTIFTPLGMTDTYVFTRADSVRSLPSFYYSGRLYPFDFLDYVYGDKNIYSTVRDLLKFNQALYDGKLLGKTVLDSAYTPYSFEKPGVHNYGLGWRMYVLKNGKKIIYHNGWWHGNRAAFYRLLDENAVIIALSNNDYKMVYRVKQMADVFGPYLQDTGEDDQPEGRIVKTVHRSSKHHRKTAVAKRKTSTGKKKYYTRNR